MILYLYLLFYKYILIGDEKKTQTKNQEIKLRGKNIEKKMQVQQY